jgi:hypothetical protein
VRRTYERFRGSWDFRQQGPLRLPLIWPERLTISSNIPDDGPAEPIPMRVVEVRLEHGYLGGCPARRLVARLNIPEIEVVLDQKAVEEITPLGDR